MRSHLWLGVCAAVLAGCGGGPTSEVEMFFTQVDGWAPDGGGTEVTCPDPGYADFDFTKACRILEALPADVFEPVPSDRVCAAVISGPETVTIKGTVNGREIDATFSRTDACREAKYQQIKPLVDAV